MQIHELTSKKRVDENFMTGLAKAAGTAVKDTVGGAVQGVKDKAGQLGAQMKDPNAWFSTKAASAAKGGAQLAQQSAKMVQQMAAEWPAVAKTITSKDAIANQQAKQPAKPVAPVATKPAAPAPTAPVAPANVAAIAPAPKSGAPTPAEQEKFQKIAQAALAKQPPVSEAFSDLPGTKLAPGNAVDPRVTKSVGRQGNPLTSAYITKFKQWSDGKLSTRETNTGQTINMDVVRKEMPELDRVLNTALTQVYNTRKDPSANQQAVTAYLSQALGATQKVAAKIRQSNPKSAARDNAKSMPGQMDPNTAKLASAMGLAQANLNKMKQVVDSQSEKVTQGTGSPTIDNLLVAAGLLK